MSRFFSSTARYLVQYVWKGTVRNGKYEGILTHNIAGNPNRSWQTEW